MALQTLASRALVTVDKDKKNDTLNEKKKTVLDEDSYTQGIEEIITRDFYPDLPNLNSQAEYYDALERNDLVKLREIQMRCKDLRPSTGVSSIYNSPDTFETPDASARAPSPSQKQPTAGDPRTDEQPELPNNVDDDKKKELSLDRYLARNTSEDNASFMEILKEGERKHREKHAWMYDKEEKQEMEHEQKLALPSIEEQAMIEPGSGRVDTWKYKPQNALMYVPDGESLSAKELIELQKHKPREIIHENTRFQFNPHNIVKSKQQMQEAASYKALANLGKIGHDGKEILPSMSPNVNGYGFVATPSPAPGVDDSPMMTWGEIESTPYRLDGGGTPLPSTPGPVFKIPAIPKRDQLALELAEKASKAHRDKKQNAIKQVTRNLSSPSPKFAMSTTDRVNSMSPAAQRLVSKKLGIKTHADKALRASYSPSPTRHSGDRTPISLTPSGTPKSRSSTPSTGSRTPGSDPRTPKRDGSDISSLTDNLLQLPKRPKAQDFF
ncbi:splicing factor ESS-2 homolog [Haliotis rufescens]|uniref:splicing factor ESS-2 homolog n=1 Tax=Haliotis rufescens TaxID=6454 RepID=UPI00201F711F|nr:splicing factor ESS-2 homolog [Haliotis rufescens]